jgi:alpha-L-fucosidase
MYGIIVHYGLYSAYAYDDIKSAKVRKVQNGSEWYYGRLIDNSTFRPISGSFATKTHHQLNYNNSNYFDIANQLSPTRNNIKKFIMQCRTVGATYIILTAKHHDGFCLWNTETTDKVSTVGICEIFAEECIKQNIEYGFYYSWFEFDKSFTIDYFNSHCVKQLGELSLLKPKYIWFDGSWKITQKQIKIKINEICKNITDKGILINDRIGISPVPNYVTWNVQSDRFIPKIKTNGWQHVNTIGYSWGYNQFDEYKDGKSIYKIYEQVQKLGGSFLLNIGPQKDFIICKDELKSLKEFFALSIEIKK